MPNFSIQLYDKIHPGQPENIGVGSRVWGLRREKPKSSFSLHDPATVVSEVTVVAARDVKFGTVVHLKSSITNGTLKKGESDDHRFSLGMKIWQLLTNIQTALWTNQKRLFKQLWGIGLIHDLSINACFQSRTFWFTSINYTPKLQHLCNNKSLRTCFWTH